MMKVLKKPHSYCRALTETVLVEEFIDMLLEEEEDEELADALKADYYKLSDMIKNCELQSEHYDDESCTLNSKSHRQRDYREEKARWDLRVRIVDELLTIPRLESDDEIDLGKGGAKPKWELQKDKQAYIVTGPPASGKSGVAATFADSRGAYILDSDYVKRKLPEFDRNAAGATLVHRESTGVIFGIQKNPKRFMPFLEHCSRSGNNIVIPRIGHGVKDIRVLATELKESYGYAVHLTVVSLDRRKATLRALDRFKRTRRYVPLSLIFDGYGNDPILTWYRLREENAKSKLFDSFGKVSTDVERGSPYRCIYAEDGNPASLYSNS